MGNGALGDIPLRVTFLFRQLWVFGSLLSNFFIDDFAARQYKNCVKIIKNKKRFDIYPVSQLGPQLTNDLH